MTEAEKNKIKSRILPHPNGGKYVSHMPFEEYQALFEDFFVLTRENGILEIRWHNNGGPAVTDEGHMRSWAQILKVVSDDPENEVLILTGTGDKFLEVDFSNMAHLMSGKLDVEKLIADSYSDVHMYGADAARELIFGVKVPTIGVYNGPAVGMGHILTMCDITLCADDLEIDEDHFKMSKLSGNGSFMSLQHFMGEKQAAHMYYTGEKITADEAKRRGYVNEVMPREDLLKRAWEIARQMMEKDRTVRRLSHEMMCHGLRKRYAEDLDYQMALGTYAYCSSLAGIGLKMRQPQDKDEEPEKS